MPTVSEVTQIIENKWGNYVQQFHSLPYQEQAAFLHAQGYARFADLLAHITAWWQEGIACIERYKNDPNFQHPEVDVDAFNARAVENARDLDENETIRQFEATRLQFMDVVASLSEADLADIRISWQIEIELSGHYEEHRIPS